MARTRWLAAAATGMVGTAFFVATALAHGVLKSSSPKGGAHLSAAPRELRLTFTEAPELAASRVELRGPDGALVSLTGLVRHSDSNTVIIAPIAGRMVAGPHTVSWQVAGADGHPVKGQFTFVIAPGAAGLGDDPSRTADPPDSAAAHHDPVSMPTSPSGFDSESAGYVLVRALLYLGMLGMIGALAFRFVVLRLVAAQSAVDADYLARSEANAARIGLLAALLVLAACLARLGAQAVALHGDRATDLALIPSMLSGTIWGRAWLLQLVATLFGLVAFLLLRRRPAHRGLWIAAGVAAVVLAFTPALASHAASTPRLKSLAIVADGLHVLGAAGWLGSLLVLIAAGIPAAMMLTGERRHAAVARLVAAFSPTAVFFAALLAATGLFAAWLHVGGFTPLWDTRYGKLLVAKLAVLSLVVLTGAYNWLRVRPALGDAMGTARIRRSISLELSIGLIVVIVTAILVATPTPLDHVQG